MRPNTLETVSKIERKVVANGKLNSIWFPSLMVCEKSKEKKTSDAFQCTGIDIDEKPAFFILRLIQCALRSAIHCSKWLLGWLAS